MSLTVLPVMARILSACRASALDGGIAVHTEKAAARQLSLSGQERIADR
jgi:hypothetical protein